VRRLTALGSLLVQNASNLKGKRQVADPLQIKSFSTETALRPARGPWRTAKYTSRVSVVVG
jgi:hypothetical protein